MDFLIVYPQSWWHNPAFIVGTKASLSALRDALTSAIDTGSGHVETMADDGEGYTMHVLAKELDDMAGMPSHYTDPDLFNQYACDKSPYDWL